MNGPIKATNEEFEKFRTFVEKKIGLKFPDNKKSLLESRLSARIHKLGLGSFGEYHKYVLDGHSAEEIDFLIDKITTHTTSFFRENFHFDFLKSDGITELKNYFPNTIIKAISLGSSTGEEMYTLSMILRDMQDKGMIAGYQIDAADVSKMALLKAKAGIFKIDHLESIPAAYKKYFYVKYNILYAKELLKQNHRYFVINICRKTQRFPDNYHIVFCRNTLIYFPKNLQQNVINNISRIVLSGGFILIGHSESLHGLKHNFERVVPTIYRGR